MGKKLKTSFNQLDEKKFKGGQCWGKQKGDLFTDLTLIRKRKDGHYNIRWLCSVCHAYYDGENYDPQNIPEVLSFFNLK